MKQTFIGTCFGCNIYAETEDKLTLSQIERYLTKLYQKQEIGEEKLLPAKFLKV